MQQKALVIELGLVDYQEAREMQLRLQQQRQEGLWPDLLILAEHPSTITLGRSGSFKHILASSGDLAGRGIAVYEVERGGDVTYHGPGQLVAYPIIDLSCRGKDIHMYVHQLEEVVIRVLRHFGITAGRRAGYPGVWIGSAKITALGVSVSKWVTMHGLALNVNPDLSCFGLIVPCGIREAEVTSIKQVLNVEGRPEPDINEVARQFKLEFADVFGYRLVKVDLYKMQVEDNDAWLNRFGET